MPTNLCTVALRKQPNQKCPGCLEYPTQSKRLTHPQLEAAKIEWQVANTPFATHQEYVKTRLHVSMQNCQPIRVHQFEFANLEKRGTSK